MINIYLQYLKHMHSYYKHTGYENNNDNNVAL